MTIQISTVSNSQNFGTWLQRTNDIIYIIGANSVTADSTTTGSVTTGNAYVNGIFGANTLYVTQITAGNIWSNGSLITITSNTYSNAYVRVGNSSINSVVIGWNAADGTVLSGNSSLNEYTAIEHNNLSNGNKASADFLLYNDNNYYSFLDVGINSTNYSDAAYSITDSNGSYILAGNSSLAIGTSSAKPVKFFANGTLGINEVMRITPGLQVGIGTTSPVGKFQVVGNSTFTGNTTITGQLTVSSNTTINGVTLLNGILNVNSTANVYYDARIGGTLEVIGEVILSNTISVTGNATFSNALLVTGNAAFSNTLAVTGNVNFSNTLNVTGLTTLSNVNINVANVANLNSSDTVRIGTVGITSVGLLANNTTIFVGNTANNTTINGNTITVSSLLATTANSANLNVSALATTANLNVTALANTVELNSSSKVNIGVVNTTSIGVSINTAAIFIGNLDSSSANTIITANTLTTNSIQAHTLNITGSISGTFKTDGNIIPTTNNNLTIGSSSNVFNTSYTTNVFANSISSFSGSLTLISNVNFISNVSITGNTFLTTLRTTALANVANLNVMVTANVANLNSSDTVRIGTSGATTIGLVANNTTIFVGNTANKTTITGNTVTTTILSLRGIKESFSGVFNYSANTIATVDSYSAGTYRSAEYTVQATETATGSYHFTKLLVTHDGSVGYVTEYGTINNNGNLLTFVVDINSGNVRLRGTPTSSNSSLSMAVKFTRDVITV